MNIRTKLFLAVLVVVAVTCALASVDKTCIPCSGQECNNNVTLFHYTNDCGKHGILKNRTIQKSLRQPNVTGDDAYFGEGTYFTQLTPTNSTDKLLFNNYGNTSRANEYKLDFYFNCSFKRSDSNLCHSKEAKEYEKGTRNIWLYDIPVNIDLYNCMSGTRSKSRRRRSADHLWSVCSRAESLTPEPGLLLAVSLVLSGLGAVPRN